MLAILQQMVDQSHGSTSPIKLLSSYSINEGLFPLLNSFWRLCYKVFLFTCKIVQGSSTSSQDRFYADCNCPRLF
jgi:hypothetical protein